jgi:hypothetical protein
MKKIMLAAIVLLSPLLMHSQSLVDEGRQWNVVNSGISFFSFSYHTEIFRITGDSLVEDVLYKKMMVSHDSLSSWSLAGLLRAEDEKVYYIHPGYDEGLLYDFGLQKGESAMVRSFFCFSEDVPVTVMDIDTVEYMGVERKRWLLGEDGWAYDIWVEGIGSLSGPLYTRYEYCIVCPVWELLCAYQTEEKIYMHSDYQICYFSSVGIDESDFGADVQLFPNPVNIGQKVQLTTAAAGSLISLYSATGALYGRFTVDGTGSLEIETGRLNPGIYTLVFTSPSGSVRSLKLLVR